LRLCGRHGFSDLFSVSEFQILLASFSKLIAGLSPFSKARDGCLIKDITDRSRKAKGVGCLKGTDVLRGGCVERGAGPAHCLLINRAPGNPAAAHRLRLMEKEHDGFKIAEADLAQRGPGEFLGTRQSGLGDFRLANLARDMRL